MINPVNDVFMIEVGGNEENVLGLVGGFNPDEGIREGIVVAIPDKMIYFGMNTYAFDKTVGEDNLLNKVYAYYAGFVGKRVYWPERSESGTVIKKDDKSYAFVKFSSIMGVEGEN